MTGYRKKRVRWLDWHGMYDAGWKGMIVDEAFAHPAKASRALIRQIFDHMQSQGWLTPRSRVLDVFGGIGTTLIEGASRGHECVGVELEERFVKLAEQNFALHKRTWEQFGDPLPVMLHGDSRKAVELVRGHFAACVGSPPFTSFTNSDNNFQAPHDSTKLMVHGKGYGQSPGQLGAMKAGDVDAVVGSPPFTDSGMNDDRQHGGMKRKPNGTGKAGGGGLTHYGQSPGQLGAMKAGDVDAVVGSPPYAETFKEGPGHQTGLKIGNESMGRGMKAMNSHGYGNTDGQLGSLREGDVDRVVDGTVGSPPYEGQEMCGTRRELEKYDRGERRSRDYGGSDGQLGHTNGETFWSAAREILLQVHELLRPGGYAAWILKDYIKNKKRVPFCDNWARLCEACGFEVVQRVRCWLVKETTNAGLFGDVTKKVERKSFFRRLHERKPGAVRIDWEEVLFVRKR